MRYFPGFFLLSSAAVAVTFIDAPAGPATCAAPSNTGIRYGDPGCVFTDLPSPSVPEPTPTRSPSRSSSESGIRYGDYGTSTLSFSLLEPTPFLSRLRSHMRPHRTSLHRETHTQSSSSEEVTPTPSASEETPALAPAENTNNAARPRYSGIRNAAAAACGVAGMAV
ncbi:hypothetical protein BU23DRAFT_553867, partial [Bimuria novae-zelandiae CBS 107.79]